MNVTRVTGAVCVIVGLGMLAAAILVPDAWFQANVNCGNTRNPRSPCGEGEAQALLRPLGAGFSIIGAVLFALGRMMRGSGPQERPLCVAPATVLAVERSERRFGSITVSRGWHDVRLLVRPPMGPSFETRVRHSALGPPLTPEALVTIGYSPDRPDEVALVDARPP